MKTRYITLDDLTDYAGPEIRDSLGSQEQAEAWLSRLEVRMEAFLEARLHQSIHKRWPVFSDNQKLHYKLALLEQAIYLWRNGDISTDAGYDVGKGETADITTIRERKIADNAKEHLILAGVWSYKVHREGLWSDGFPTWLW